MATITNGIMWIIFDPLYLHPHRIINMMKYTIVEKYISKSFQFTISAGG